MLNDTIVNGLKPYRIGEKLRALRLKKKLGLVELAKHSGLSPALLSKLERGKLFPTLPTLLRIALVFSVGLDYFFSDESKRHIVSVVRKDERLRFPERPNTKDPAYFFESLDFAASEPELNAFLADFEHVPAESLRLHQHPGVEFLHTLTGKLELVIGGVPYELNAGDSIYFDSAVPHTYRNAQKKPCSAVVVTTE
ncbi:MAG TPA: XRE family transcriptional regulator [Candidatus Koribacter sp.]|jgi:transcriptional regulator with XRE-family HTH domain